MPSSPWLLVSACLASAFGCLPSAGSAFCLLPSAFSFCLFPCAFCLPLFPLFLHLHRLADDALEQLAGVSGFCRGVRGPHVGVVGGEDVREVGFGRLHRQRRELRDRHRARPFVLVLDQQPAGFRSAAEASRADQRPRALQLVAVEGELQITLAQGGVHVRHLRCPGAAVPQHHDAGAVSLRDHALEGPVGEGVILGLHRQPLVGRVDGWPLGNGPRQQHAVPFEAQVVVQVRGEVLLHGKEQRPLLPGFGGLGPVGFGGL